MLRIFAALSLLLLPVPLAAQEPPAGHLTMTGSARVAAEPDIVRAHANVYAEDDSAVKALRAATDDMARLRGAMAPFGEVAVSRIELGQNRSKSSRLIASDDPRFTARGQATVTLADVSRAGEALDVLVRSGVDGIVRLEYDVADRTALTTEAREKAVADAFDKARTYARAAQLILGPVVDLTETGADVLPARDGAMAHGYGSSHGAQGAAGPHSFGVGASVTIRWRVTPGS